MHRRGFVAACGSALAWPASLNAQPAARLPRIGFITGAEGPTPGTAAFVRALLERGQVPGKTLEIEWRYAAGHAERFADFVRELVALPVDIILTSGPQPTVLASRATKSIPIVMAATTDPVRLGIVASLAQPGGNVTGVTADVTPDFFGKQIQLMKEIFPRVRRIGVLLNPELQGAGPWVEAVERAAAQLKLRTARFALRAESELPAVFAACRRDQAEALLVLPDPGMFGFRQKLVEAELQARLPAMHFLVEFVVAGGLMSYGPLLLEQFERAASYVDKILKGAKPQDLPVEQPTKFELVLNQRTVKALGLTIPSRVLARADRVIE